MLRVIGGLLCEGVSIFFIIGARIRYKPYSASLCSPGEVDDCTRHWQLGLVCPGDKEAGLLNHIETSGGVASFRGRTLPTLLKEPPGNRDILFFFNFRVLNIECDRVNKYIHLIEIVNIYLKIK